MHIAGSEVASGAARVGPLTIGFQITGIDYGASATVTETLPLGVNAYWKLQNSAWSQLVGATFSGKQVTFALTDGGTGDADPANGVITDPGAPAIAPVVLIPRFRG